MRERADEDTDPRRPLVFPSRHTSPKRKRGYIPSLALRACVSARRLPIQFQTQIELRTFIQDARIRRGFPLPLGTELELAIRPHGKRQPQVLCDSVAIQRAKGGQSASLEFQTNPGN